MSNAHARYPAFRSIGYRTATVPFLERREDGPIGNIQFEVRYKGSQQQKQRNYEKIKYVRNFEFWYFGKYDRNQDNFYD
jgi:hypothetical protein